MPQTFQPKTPHSMVSEQAPSPMDFNIKDLLLLKSLLKLPESEQSQIRQIIKGLLYRQEGRFQKKMGQALFHLLEASEAEKDFYQSFQQLMPSEQQQVVQYLKQLRQPLKASSEEDPAGPSASQALLPASVKINNVLESLPLAEHAEAKAVDDSKETVSTAAETDPLELLKELGLEPTNILPKALTFREKFSLWNWFHAKQSQFLEGFQIHQFKLFRKSFVWLLPLMLFAGIAAVDTFVDLVLFWPEGKDLSTFFHLDRQAAMQILAGINRSMNQILGACMIALVIALPLIANLYTPRLVSTFSKDPITLITLILMVMNNGNTIWTLYIFNYVEVPVFQVYSCILLFVVCVVMMIPYFLKILHYLDPYFLILSLETEIHEEFEKLQANSEFSSESRTHILDQLSTLNNMIMKGLSRNDREMATEGIRAEHRILDAYASIKKKMPEEWQEIDYSTFIGMSTRGVEEVTRRRIWFELYLMHFMLRVFIRSLKIMPELCSAISELLYRTAIKYMNSGEPETMRLCMVFFNTFLGEGIRNKATDSIHNVFYQYRLFAEMSLSMDNIILCEAAENFRKYSWMAAENNLWQIRDTALYDLVHLAYVAKNYAGDEEAYQVLCQKILDFDPFKYPEETNSILKAHLIFAGLLVSHGEETLLQQLWPYFYKIPKERLQIYYTDLLIYNEKIQPEITDRFVSSAYLSEEQSLLVREVFQLLGITGGASCPAP
ncbi:DUF2254 family protein [Deltaproteobacteria bacterium TL4]